MDLFPERADSRSSRRLLPAALLASLLFHLAFGGVWGFFTRQVVPVVAKLVPRPTATPEIVALSDAITIEKRTVLRAAHRTPRTRPVRRQPRQIAQQAVPVRDDDDEAGYRFAAHAFVPGEYVSIRDEDGEMHTFQVISVEPAA